MGRLAVLALLVTAVSGFVPGARPLRTAPRAASRSTRTVRMAMVRIVFTIKPNGVVQEEVQGLKGPACYQLTDSLNKALGGTVFETTPTEEYYMEPEEVRVFFALRSRRVPEAEVAGHAVDGVARLQGVGERQLRRLRLRQ